MLTILQHLLFPAIIAFCCIGAFSVNNSVFDVFMMALFGVVGYALIKLDFEPAPLLLGFVLGPMLEENLRRAMLLSRAALGVRDPPAQPRPAGGGSGTAGHRGHAHRALKREEAFSE